MTQPGKATHIACHEHATGSVSRLILLTYTELHAAQIVGTTVTIYVTGIS